MVKRKTIKNEPYKINFIWDASSSSGPFISMFVYKSTDDGFRYQCSHELKISKNKVVQRFNNIVERIYTDSDIKTCGYSSAWSAALFRAKAIFDEYGMTTKFPVK